MSSTIRYKFRSQLAFDVLRFEGHFLTVGEAKAMIADKKGLGADAVPELVLRNETIKKDYDDDNAQLLKNTTVTVRRMPAAALQKPLKALVGATPAPVVAGISAAAGGAAAPSVGAAAGAATASLVNGNHATVDEFADEHAVGAGGSDTGGDYVPAVPAAVQAFIDSAAKGIQLEEQQAAAAGWGRGGGPGGRGGGGRGGFGRGRGAPATYVCMRCGQLGHYLNDCPTNGDPMYDKRYRPPVGIPSSKIQRNPDGSLFLPDGETGELAPNRAAFNHLASILPSAVRRADTPERQDAGTLPAASQQQPHLQQPPQSSHLQPSQQQQQQPVSPTALAASALAMPSLAMPPLLIGGVTAVPTTSIPALASTLPPIAGNPTTSGPSSALAVAAPTGAAASEVGTQHALVPASLFDDDEVQLPAHLPGKLALGMEVPPASTARSGSPSTGSASQGVPAASQQHQQQLQPVQQHQQPSRLQQSHTQQAPHLHQQGQGKEGSRAGLPDDRMGMGRFLDLLPELSNIVPAEAPIGVLMQAFAAGRPLSPAEFMQLQEHMRRKGGGGSNLRPDDGDRGRDVGRHPEVRDVRGHRERDGRGSSRERDGGERDGSRHRSGREKEKDKLSSRHRDKERERSHRNSSRQRSRSRSRSVDRDREGSAVAEHSSRPSRRSNNGAVLDNSLRHEEHTQHSHSPGKPLRDVGRSGRRERSRSRSGSRDGTGKAEVQGLLLDASGLQRPQSNALLQQRQPPASAPTSRWQVAQPPMSLRLQESGRGPGSGILKDAPVVSNNRQAQYGSGGAVKEVSPSERWQPVAPSPDRWQPSPADHVQQRSISPQLLTSPVRSASSKGARVLPVADDMERRSLTLDAGVEQKGPEPSHSAGVKDVDTAVQSALSVRQADALQHQASTSPSALPAPTANDSSLHKARGPSVAPNAVTGQGERMMGGAPDQLKPSKHRSHSKHKRSKDKEGKEKRSKEKKSSKRRRNSDSDTDDERPTTLPVSRSNPVEAAERQALARPEKRPRSPAEGEEQQPAGHAKEQQRESKRKDKERPGKAKERTSRDRDRSSKRQSRSRSRDRD